MASSAELLQLAETDVAHEISKEKFGPVIVNPPFVYIDGTFNTRDLGLVPHSPIRAGFAYRAGSLGHLTDNGKAMISGKLGIKRIFDIRTSAERTMDPDPEIPGVENTWIDSSVKADDYVDLNKFISGVGEEGYCEMYLGELSAYTQTWRAILEHVRNRPQDPFIFHCTAGRDRTGILAGLLFTLAGAPPDLITLDWLLSRIGTEPVREMLVAFAMAGANAKSQEDPGFYNLCNLRADCWSAFVAGVQKEYGGFQELVITKLGFSADDVAKIKKNLTKA